MPEHARVAARRQFFDRRERSCLPPPDRARHEEQRIADRRLRREEGRKQLAVPQPVGFVHDHHIGMPAATRSVFPRVMLQRPSAAG